LSRVQRCRQTDAKSSSNPPVRVRTQHGPCTCEQFHDKYIAVGPKTGWWHRALASSATYVANAPLVIVLLACMRLLPRYCSFLHKVGGINPHRLFFWLSATRPDHRVDRDHHGTWPSASVLIRDPLKHPDIPCVSSPACVHHLFSASHYLECYASPPPSHAFLDTRVDRRA
jgi:hypothetical protein